MAQTAYPKVGGATTDQQFRNMMNVLIETGVSTPTGYAVVGDSSGMNVKIATGLAFVSGIIAVNDAQITQAIAAAPAAGLARIDTVALQLDYTKNPIVQEVVIAGTAAASGSQAPPSLAPSGNVVFNMPLADVLVNGGAVTITSGNVTDRRTFTGTNVGFWSAATRPAAPTTRLFGYNITTAQWEGYVGGAWTPVTVPAGAVGAQVIAAATIQAAREAIGLFVQPAAPANVAGRVWIKSAS